MITADHLAEAKAYVDELTNSADYIVGTPEWLEHLTTQLPEVDPFALYAWAIERGNGWGSPDTASVQGALITGAIVVLFAQRIAERDTDPREVPSQRFATLPGSHTGATPPYPKGCP